MIRILLSFLRPVGVASLLTLFQLPSAEAALPESNPGDWTGSWEIHRKSIEEQHAGGLLLVMKQDGENVTGEYPLLHGRIEAKAIGTKLMGRWYEGNLSGKFTLFLQDGSILEGNDDSGEWWTGKRMNSNPSPLKGNLDSPRGAIAAFLRAGNLALDGHEENWEKALLTVDFGKIQSSMPGIEQLRMVRELFQLVDLTTFHLSSIPDSCNENSLDIKLKEVGSDACLTLTLLRDSAGTWRILMPSQDEMRASRSSFLAIHGGQAPASDACSQLGNPRDALRTFQRGMESGDQSDLELALSTLDLSLFPEFLRNSDGLHAAQCLYEVLNRIGFSTLQSVSNDGASREPYICFVKGKESITIAPVGSGTATRWKFTAKTMNKIPDLFFSSDVLPAPLDPEFHKIRKSPYFALRSFLGRHVPFLLKTGMVPNLEIWQSLFMLLTLSLAICIARVASRACCRHLSRLSKAEGNHQHVLLWSLRIVIVIFMMYPVPTLLGLPDSNRRITVPFLGVLFTLGAACVIWHLLSVIGNLMTAWAKQSPTRTDDILLAISLAVLRCVVVMVAALSVAYFLSIPTTSMLAGLGISGLAVAFASREALSNIFGAGVLLVDRPFKGGDWIRTDKFEGSVEDVGIRSTRIRTAEDSVMVVPNSKLVESMIDNRGTRRHRLVNMTILITGGASPENLDAFTEGVRQRMINDELFTSKRLDVRVASLSKVGVEVELNGYLDVSTRSSENEARHRLLIDVMRIAEGLGLTLGDALVRKEQKD